MNPFSKATILVVVGLFASQVRAQNPGDVGSPECRAVQLQTQAAVLAGAPYRTKGGAQKAATRVVDPAVRSGSITSACASCILSQFARGIPIAQQRSCGPICGNGECQRGEDACTCHVDCASTCGDGCCFRGNADNGTAIIENSCNCPGDCGTSCGACCLPDDSCEDRIADECIALGGEHQGSGTSCASTECCAENDAGCGPNADCCNPNAACVPLFPTSPSSRCCIPLGVIGCGAVNECCSGSLCEAGTCCNVIGDACALPEHCCGPNAVCSGNTCCIPPGGAGCADVSECCASRHCEAGKCCAATGDQGQCGIDAHCCNPNASCVASKCCVPDFLPCTQPSDCCSGSCTGEMCEGVFGP